MKRGNNIVESTTASESRGNLASFEVRRAIIVHEDQLINARLTTLLVAHSFLATAAVILLANAESAASPQGFYWLTLLIAALSILLGVLTDYSITAARLAQHNVRGAETVYERVFPFAGEKADDWRRCLQSYTRLTEHAGIMSAIGLPVITTFMWILFVYYCVARIYDRNIAVMAFVILFALVAAAFVGIRLRYGGDNRA